VKAGIAGCGARRKFCMASCDIEDVRLPGMHHEGGVHACTLKSTQMHAEGFTRCGANPAKCGRNTGKNLARISLTRDRREFHWVQKK
jgi:hypothetical protein